VALLLLAVVSTVLAAPLAVDAERSTLRVHARSSLHDFEIEARAFSGRLDPAEGAGSLDLPVAGLTSGVGPRDARMRGWCLDERAHPALRFDVGRIEGDTPGLRAGVGSGEVVLVGALTIREATRALSVPASYAWEGSALRLRGRVPLRWAEWGIPDPAVALSMLGPDLTVAFDVLAAAASVYTPAEVGDTRDTAVSSSKGATASAAKPATVRKATKKPATKTRPKRKRTSRAR
jgi:hypothetical protein